MRKALLFGGVLLLAWSAAATAAGVNVTWGSGCWADLHSNLQTFACDTNTGPAIRMTVSFQVDADIPDFVGMTAYVVGRTSVATMPDWWMLSPGQCRPAPGFSANFTGAPYNTSANCSDIWQGQGSGGLTVYADHLTPGWNVDPNVAQMSGTFLLAEPRALRAGTEWYACQFLFDRSSSTGTGACARCTIPMTWKVHKLRLFSSQSYLDLVDEDLEAWNACAFWQATTVPCAWWDSWVEPPVPARNATWGQIKSLYH